MDNPNEGNYYQPYSPQDPVPNPAPQYYDGNPGFATASLVMGILGLLSMCCFPLIALPFAGLGVLFSCLSKGKFTRPGTAKAGLAISASLLGILTAISIVACALVFSSPTAKNFLRDYVALFTSDYVTEQDIYEFLDKYTDQFSGSSQGDDSEPGSSYEDGQDSYEDYYGDYFDDYLDDYYDYFNGGDGYPDYSYPDGGGFSDEYPDVDPSTGDHYI